MRPTRLRQAKTNNLRSVSLDLDPGSLVAVVGPSGAGKTSLVFQTLYAEGQRRYVESFSAYARQFLERLPRPPVEVLEPVPAAVSVDRKTPVRTSRSTVGTMTDISDYAKDLWAKVADLQCPGCQETIKRNTADKSADQLLKKHENRRIVVSYQLPITSPEHFLAVREDLIRDGYRRIWRNGDTIDLDEVRPSSAVEDEAIHVVIDRSIARPEERSRIVEALEYAMTRASRVAEVHISADKGKYRKQSYSSALRCTKCEKGFEAPAPGLFSFNSPLGACETCRGFGRVIAVDYDKVIPDKSLSLKEGAIRPWRSPKSSWERQALSKHARRAGVPIDIPFEKLSDVQRTWVIEGDGGDWFGLQGWFRWLEGRTYKMHVRVLLSRYRKYDLCPACHGTRLKPESLWWKIQGKSIGEFQSMPVSEAFALCEKERSKLSPGDKAGKVLIDECLRRLGALRDVGLSYLSLDRTARTLSGGEAQRVGLTSAIGASLTDALLVLDEPTTGLHPMDVGRLGATLRNLARDGNLVMFTDHDQTLIEQADRIIELGPGAGSDGGTVVFDGNLAELYRAKTKTGQSFSKQAAVFSERCRNATEFTELKGAKGHNLKNADLRFPRNTMTCVTGVSGSGKSTLVQGTLVPALMKKLGIVGDSSDPALPFRSISGWRAFSSIVSVDQSPLGRTSRGNPATYLKIWDALRKRLSNTEEAKARGYTPGYFSFNTKGGRCETCRGEGAETVEMQFLADVHMPCSDCQGKRFVGPVLDIRWKGKNVSELLALTFHELAELAGDEKSLAKPLATMRELGLDYLRLGQPLSTLSGGEAQRLRLAEALAKLPENALLVLDEPTAGLHSSDVQKILKLLHKLVEEGATVLAIEHDMSFVLQSDFVIDIGPGAGNDGGCVVASGTPEDIATEPSSMTGRALKEFSSIRKRSKSRKTHSTKPSEQRNESRKGRTTGRHILIESAKEHNLKGVSTHIPMGSFVTVTGPSGSGKSTLAFDVLFAEGQRRYLETLTPYARQYMPQLPRPNVDKVSGVPPCVALEQLTHGGSHMSTVATLTEVSHAIRLLYARLGTLYCPECAECDVPIAPQSPSQLAKLVRKQFPKENIRIAAPLVRGRKGAYKELFARLLKDGFEEVLIDGTWTALQPNMSTKRYAEHDIAVCTATLQSENHELEDEIERAADIGEGTILVTRGKRTLTLSTKRTCTQCGKGFGELDPRLFSFNTRQGACETCEGRGVVGEPQKTAGRKAGRRKKEEGTSKVCQECGGSRLSKLARSVRLGTYTIDQVLGWTVQEANKNLPKLLKSKAFDKGIKRAVGEAALAEALRRLGYLSSLGLDYLELGRAASSLSGGENQRVRLASQLGSGLTGLLYVLDEPTIGLHPRDTERLIKAIRALVDGGSTVLVVEHDEETITASDHVIEVGPGGGNRGGTITYQGKPRSLAGDKKTTKPATREVKVSRSEKASQAMIELRGAKEHNLKNVHLRIPQKSLVAITGVSGSGKSTLLRRVFLPALRQKLGFVADRPGNHKDIRGEAGIRRAVEIDQSPIGRTPRSVPATYIGIWDNIRSLFAATPEARARGYSASRFSFNVAEGRCETCAGQGTILKEMSFLPNMHVPCEACRGARFSRETLEVRFRGKTIGDILQMEIENAATFFQGLHKIAAPLELLRDLGLGYLQLGQPSGTLSGGEAQRIKLVAELAVGQKGHREQEGGTLYVMDEPTTGLNGSDVVRLIEIFKRFVERGDTVVVIEHQLDLIREADWIVDMGPEAGAYGGSIVVEGTPQQVMKSKTSFTGKALRQSKT